MTTEEGKKGNEVYIYRVTGHVTVCADNSMGGMTMLTQALSKITGLECALGRWFETYGDRLLAELDSMPKPVKGGCYR